MQIPTLTGAQNGRIISEKNGRILIKERFFLCLFFEMKSLVFQFLVFLFCFLPLIPCVICMNVSILTVVQNE